MRGRDRRGGRVNGGAEHPRGWRDGVAGDQSGRVVADFGVDGRGSATPLRKACLSCRDGRVARAGGSIRWLTVLGDKLVHQWYQPLELFERHAL